jgi:hypothetical protein
MTLKEQAEVLARITASAASDYPRSEAIRAVREDRASAGQAALVLSGLERYAARRGARAAGGGAGAGETSG